MVLHSVRYTCSVAGYMYNYAPTSSYLLYNEIIAKPHASYQLSHATCQLQSNSLLCIIVSNV